MKFLLGKKLEMSQVFREDGTVVPVTLIEAGPCTVTNVRTNQAGEKTVQIGFGAKNHVNKPQREDWKDLGAFAFVREVPVAESADVKRGQVFGADVFEEGATVDVTGTAKGRGFQGVVKRHGFHGSPATHGHKDQLRMPGSIGAQGPQRVFKGKRMPGRMGGNRVTVKNLEVVQVDPKRGVIAVKGAVPGSRGSFLILKGTEGTVWQS